MTRTADIFRNGPAYTIDSAALKRFRQAAKAGLASLSKAERNAYAEAVEARIKAAQCSELRKASRARYPKEEERLYKIAMNEKRARQAAAMREA